MMNVHVKCVHVYDHLSEEPMHTINGTIFNSIVMEVR